MSCTVPPLFRYVGGLLPVYRADLGNFQSKSYMFKFFVTDFSASAWGNDFKFCIQLQHDELCPASPFQVCRRSTSTVYRADLGNFQPKSYMCKFFVTDFSASAGGNDFKFCIQLQHDELYRASPFQVCRRSTSCLPSRLRQFSAWKLHVQIFRNRFLSFCWRKWFQILYTASTWWVVPCLPFSSLSEVYFLINRAHLGNFQPESYMCKFFVTDF